DARGGRRGRHLLLGAGGAADRAEHAHRADHAHDTYRTDDAERHGVVRTHRPAQRPGGGRMSDPTGNNTGNNTGNGNGVSSMVGGRYELGELLGRGGMAEVRKGTDTRLGRVVAVKRLRTD